MRMEVRKMRIFPTKVLLATDGSEEASRAADAAVELCEITGSELHVVHVGAVVPPMLFAYPEPTDPREWSDGEDPTFDKGRLEALLEREARKLLERQVERIESAGGAVADSHLEMGDAVEKIVAVGEQLGAGLVIVGSRGLTGVKRAVMGSVSESIVRYAHCPVFVVRLEEGRA